MAVALGIGVAMAGVSSAVAEASPADSTDSSAAREPSATSPTKGDIVGSAERPRSFRVYAGPSTGRKSDVVNGSRGPGAKSAATVGMSVAGQHSDEPTSATSAKTSLLIRRLSPEVVENRIVIPAAIAPISAAATPVAPSVISFAAAGPQAADEAPVKPEVRVLADTVDAVLSGPLGASPGVPMESAMSWVVVAAARRDLGISAAEVTPTVAAPFVPPRNADVTSAQSSAASTVPAPAAADAAVPGASAASTITPKDSIDIGFSGLNSSIGWIPGVGTVINGAKLAIDVVSLAVSVLALDIAQVITEMGNLVADTIGLVPVVGAPVASLLYQTVLGGNAKLGALVQGSLQSYLDSDSLWAEDQFYVEAVDVAVGLGGSHAGIATVSKPNHAGVGVMVDITNTGFETGWSVPLEGRLQLLGLAFS